MELLMTSIHGNNQFDRPLVYVIITLTIALAATQIIVLNLGMAQNDAISFIPMYQVTYPSEPIPQPIPACPPPIPSTLLSSESCVLASGCRLQ